MSALEALIASLAGDKLKGAGISLPGAGASPGGDETAPAGKITPKSLEDLIGKMIPAPIPMGTPMAQGYAPGGPQLNFTGGSPFPVNETPQTVHNGMILATELAKILGEFRKKRAEAQAAAKAQSAASKGK